MDFEIRPFSTINLEDSFFDDLKTSYPEFSDWFNRKSEQGEEAVVSYNDGHLCDFLYTKIEEEELGTTDHISPSLPAKKRLKVGTFKVDARHTRRADRFMKRIMDIAIAEQVEEIYVTVFPRHEELIRRFENYGFEEKAHKEHETTYELVLVKDMKSYVGDIVKDYPKIKRAGTKKYLLSIYPKFHTQLFPDSILRNEESYKYDLIKDLKPTNSINKVYICFMKDVQMMKKGDVVTIYRTSDEPGRAYYRSVVTSICSVVNIATKADFLDEDDFVRQVKNSSVFNESDLRLWYKKPNVFVIRLQYNIALTKKVTRQSMINELGFNPDVYWGFFPMSDMQFNALCQKGEVNENYFVD